MAIKTYPTRQSQSWGSTGDLAAIVPAYYEKGHQKNIYPSRLQFNAALNLADESIDYLLQGITEFRVGQDYGLNRVVADGGKLYKSLANQTAVAGDLADETKWELLDTKGIQPTEKTVSTPTALTTGEKFAKVSSAVLTTLPPLATVKAGDIFTIKVGNVSGATVNPNGADTIDGSNSTIILAPYECFQVRASVGLTEWERI